MIFLFENIKLKKNLIRNNILLIKELNILVFFLFKFNNNIKK